jgi:hypothetical protein
MFPLEAKAYRHVLSQFGLDFLPRILGFPKQVLLLREAAYVNNGSSREADGLDILLRQMSMWDGKKPLFTSVNGWPDYHWDGRSFWPRRFHFGALFFDLDCKTDRTFALEDARKLERWAAEYDFRRVGDASGGKGFHSYLLPKPEDLPYDETLRRQVHAISLWLKDTLGLSTLDMKCAEPRRLTRLPWSLHVRESEEDESWICNGRRVLPLVPEDLHSLSIEEIDQRATTEVPHDGEFARGSVQPTLSKIIEEFHIPLRSSSPTDIREIPASEPLTGVPTGFWPDLITTLEPRLCVRNAVFTNAPPHEMRVAFATGLHQLQYMVPELPIGDEKFWQDFFWQMEEAFGWKDRFNHRRRREQVRSIFGNDRYISSTSCEKLAIEYEACVGSQCPFYAEASKKYGFRVVR